MSRFRCKHCGEDTGSSDCRTCGRCACMTVGRWVQTPNGPGEIIQARHSGGLIVQLADRTRQFSGSQLTIVDKPTTPTATPTREPGCDDQPAPTPRPEQETAAALVRLEREEMTRLERIHAAGRLELVLRCREFDRIQQYVH